MPRELLENQAAEDVVGRRVIDVIGRNDVILLRAVLEFDVNGKRLARALDVQRDAIADVGFPGEQVAETSSFP